MSLTIHVPRQHWTLADKIREAFGRPVGRLPGSHLSDLSALRQCILLCPMCEGKYRPRRNGYRAWRDYLVRAKCDVCRAETPRTVAFMAEEYYAQVIPNGHGHRGRWAL